MKARQVGDSQRWRRHDDDADAIISLCCEMLRPFSRRAMALTFMRCAAAAHVWCRADSMPRYKSALKAVAGWVVGVVGQAGEEGRGMASLRFSPLEARVAAASGASARKRGRRQRRKCEGYA